MHPLVLTGLWPLMTMSAGDPDVVVALIDGPVADHPGLNREAIRGIGGRSPFCTDLQSVACKHGTFVAGILNARRGPDAPALCPGCTLLIRPIFLEYDAEVSDSPSAFPVELAQAVIECIEHGARIINLSVEIVEPSARDDDELNRALDLAADRGVVVVAAAGNRGVLEGSVLTRHPWVIPVAGCDLQGRPVAYSNKPGAVFRRGVMAPGEKVDSIVSNGEPFRLIGTSISVPFVAGAVALLWSLLPDADGYQVRSSLIRSCLRQHRPHLPPLLDACGAWGILQREVLGEDRSPLKAA